MACLLWVGITHCSKFQACTNNVISLTRWDLAASSFVCVILSVYLFIAVRSFFSTSEMSKFNFTGQRGLGSGEGRRGLILKMFIRVIWNKWLSKQNEVLAGAGSPVDLYKKLYSVELSWALSEHTHFLELCCSAETSSFSELLQYR